MTEAIDDFVVAFDKFLTKKVGSVTRYEYCRIVRKFMVASKGKITEDEFKIAIAEFLDLKNPNSYRNTLAALRKLFEFIGQSQTMEDFKYKAIMPTFNIATPTLQEMIDFGKALNPEIQPFYYIGLVSAIRKEHLLRLTKNLFDTQNNMINTFMKTFSKKNFFFSFYTIDSKAYIEKYLSTLEPDELLFKQNKRTIIKEFKKARCKTGLQIYPKTMRKFTTNYLRRHGMISEDVDIITSHVPKSIVANHYLDTSRLKEEYQRAMQDIKLNL